MDERVLTDYEIELIKKHPLDYDFICRNRKCNKSISYIHDVYLFSYQHVMCGYNYRFLKNSMSFHKDDIFNNVSTTSVIDPKIAFKRNYSEEFQQDLIDYGATQVFHLVLNPTENLKNAIKLNNL